MINFFLKTKKINYLIKSFSTNTILNQFNNITIESSKFFEPTNISLLSNCLKLTLSKNPAYRFKYDSTKVIKEAAVLLIICLHNNKPSILFTVRTSNLNSHGGEISFPGGKKDQVDNNLLETALRETFEEIGIKSDQIQILGQLPPLPNKNGNMKVFPYIGIISPNQGFNVLDQLSLNKHEVEQCFYLPLEQLLSEKGVTKWDSFRNLPIQIPRYATPQHINGDIWGLTGFIIHNFFKSCLSNHYHQK